MLQIKNISKEYRTGGLTQKALDHVTLSLRDSEFVAILGPSGSGKTTLLNIIGGLDRYDEGDLVINGISTKKYKDRDWDSYRNHTIGFVFQSYNLIPHQTVLSNVELALTISGIGKEERRKRALAALAEVGLSDHVFKKPNQLSGGQMQRVAIARALVNDPDIVLADEPTGALDSETSVQVMELLKEVAKDRLVVMVTHNPELAETYATRIVKLKDGKIIADDHPLEEEDSLIAPAHRTMGKTFMNFFTSLSLSFNNLKTKKGRTILTAFAGSIGIIGIALILSLSNGVNNYINDIEEETLSEYPLQIQSSSFDMTAMMTDHMAGEGNGEKAEPAGDVKVGKMLESMFSTVGSNDLKSLKIYLESSKSGIEQYTNAIEYNYNVLPQIYRQDGDDVRQVHPDQSFSAMGFGGSSTNSMMNMMMNTNVFSQLPKNENLYKDQYDIKAGRWPQKYNECILVLTESGKVGDFLLYTLGLRDSADLDKMVDQFMKEEEITIPKSRDSYDYEDILNVKFKLVDAVDYYEYDSNYDVWKDKQDNQKYMKNLVKNGEDIKIVGIVQPRENAGATMLMTGLYYPSSLTEHVISNAENSKIVKEQLKHKNVNVFTGKKFDAKNEDGSNFDMNSLFKIDEAKMQSAFQIDESKLHLDLSGLEDAMANVDTPQVSMEDMAGQLSFQVTSEQKTKLLADLGGGYQLYVQSHPEATFDDYLQTQEADAIVMANMMEVANANQLEAQMQAVMGGYIMQSMATVNAAIQEELAKSMAGLGENMSDAFSFDGDAFADAIEVDMSEEDLSELMQTMMSKETFSYEGNLNKLGYASFESPSMISIYPKDFETKENVVAILDRYNADMEAAGEDEKVISYTDIVGNLMSSVTTIINTISYVLIAFVAISLVVSSIMIGVITYISVLERKKEIGILRAMGASKKNISQVFNAETFIIGALAGILGIGVTLLLLIPANAVIHAVAENPNINAALPAVGGVVLIILSTVLTLIGGIIPSRKAAKEDPVTALRTE